MMINFNAKTIIDNGFTDEQLDFLVQKVKESFEIMNLKLKDSPEVRLHHNIDDFTIYSEGYLEKMVYIDLIDYKLGRIVIGHILLSFKNITESMLEPEIKFNTAFIDTYQSDIFNHDFSKHLSALEFSFNRDFIYRSHKLDINLFRDILQNNTFLIELNKENKVIKDRKHIAKSKHIKGFASENIFPVDFKFDINMIIFYLFFDKKIEHFNDIFPEYNGEFSFEKILSDEDSRLRLDLLNMIHI